MKLFNAAVLTTAVAAAAVIESSGSPQNAVAFLGIVVAAVATINLVGAYSDWARL